MRDQALFSQQQLRKQLKSLRLTRPEQFHLTLAFFAELPEEQVEIVKESMVSVGRCFAPFRLVFDTLGAFPSFRRARVFWLGPSAPADTPLTALHADLTHRLHEGGLTLERRSFHLHLTLGRARQPARLSPETVRNLQPDAIESPVDRLILFASELTPHGAIHRELLTVPLTGC